MSQSPRVALALGGGGARGYAHIGILEHLTERGFDVIGVSGTSMGALVGGLYAAGGLDPYAEWVRGLTQRDVLRLLDPSLRAPGALRGEKIMAEVRSNLGDVRIEDLRIPYTAVATDLISHREVWFQRGRVDVAIRASIALPTVFTPVLLNGRLLADGGMLNPLPMAPLSALSADLTIGVDLFGESVSEPEPEPEAPSKRQRQKSRGVHSATAEREENDSASEAQAGADVADERRMPEWRTVLQQRIEEIRETEPVRKVAGWFERQESAGVPDESPAESRGHADDEHFGDLPSGLGYRDVMTMSYEAMQEVIARYREASYPSDLTIRVPRNSAHTLDFHRGSEMIEMGRTLAEEALADAGW